MPNDITMIENALRLFFQPGDVFEIRALDAVTPEFRRAHVESGYFDFDHIPDAAKAVSKLQCRGVYATVNPVNPALLARSANRMQAAGRDSASKDSDVLCRRWLLIDCDPVRPSGISATNEEHARAFDKAMEIRDGLKSMGFPEPIVCDSGNGAQLMYRVDLPCDDEGLIQACLKELAKANSDQVQIDQTVHNPARIWRIPGTMNCKGDSLPERPHRLATILEAPERLEAISGMILKKLANTTETSSAQECAGTVDISSIAGSAPSKENTFRVDAWIATHCPEVEAPQPWNGGRKWIFPVCPFNPDHTNRSAAIFEQPSGAIAFACRHNGCKNYGWTELRSIKEPTRTPPISTTAPQIIVPIAPVCDGIADPGPIPERLLRIPGFVSEVMDYTLRTSPYKHHVLSFAGALTLQAFLASRKLMDSMRNMSNIYLVALADSGTGKDHPRVVNREILFNAGFDGRAGDRFASGESLEDVLFVNGSMLFQVDEMHTLMGAISSFKEPRYANIAATLLKMFSSSSSTYEIRIKAGDAKVRSIRYPGVTIFGTAIPEKFYAVLNADTFTDGMMARTLIIEGEGRARAVKPPYEEIPKSIIARARWWANFIPGNDNGDGNLAVINPRPKIVPWGKDADDFITKIMAKADDEYERHLSLGDLAGKTEWTRAVQKTLRLALIYAASECPENPVVSLDGLRWAWDFTRHITERMIFMAHTRISENSFHADCLKIMEKVRNSGGSIGRSSLLKYSKLSHTKFDEVIATLMLQDDLDAIKNSTAGRTGTIYIIPPQNGGERRG